MYWHGQTNDHLSGCRGEEKSKLTNTDHLSSLLTLKNLHWGVSDHLKAIAEPLIFLNISLRWLITTFSWNKSLVTFFLEDNFIFLRFLKFFWYLKTLFFKKNFSCNVDIFYLFQKPSWFCFKHTFSWPLIKINRTFCRIKF